MDTPHWRPHLHPYRHVLSVPRFSFSWQLPRASNKKRKRRKNRQDLQCDRPMKTMTTTTTMIKQCLTRGSHRRPASDSPDNRQLVSCNCRQGSLQPLLPNGFDPPLIPSCTLAISVLWIADLNSFCMWGWNCSWARDWAWHGDGVAHGDVPGGDSTGCHYE